MNAQPPQVSTVKDAGVSRQSDHLRAQIALCCLIAFMTAWLIAFAPGPSKLALVFLLALACGTLLDLPGRLPLGTLALYSLPAGAALLVGIATWYALYRTGADRDLLLLRENALPAVAIVPLLFVCYIARPAIIDLAAGIFRFARLAQESGFRLGVATKLVVAVVAGMAGISFTDLPDIVRSILAEGGP